LPSPLSLHVLQSFFFDFFAHSHEKLSEAILSLLVFPFAPIRVARGSFDQLFGPGRLQQLATVFVLSEFRAQTSHHDFFAFRIPTGTQSHVLLFVALDRVVQFEPPRVPAFDFLRGQFACYVGGGSGADQAPKFYRIRRCSLVNEFRFLVEVFGSIVASPVRDERIFLVGIKVRKLVIVVRLRVKTDTVLVGFEEIVFSRFIDDDDVVADVPRIDFRGAAPRLKKVFRFQRYSLDILRLSFQRFHFLKFRNEACHKRFISQERLTSSKGANFAFFFGFVGVSGFFLLESLPDIFVSIGGPQQPKRKRKSEK
jgi:hypothetical protein